MAGLICVDDCLTLARADIQRAKDSKSWFWTVMHKKNADAQIAWAISLASR